MNKDEASLLDFTKPYKFDTTFKENGVEHTYSGEENVVKDRNIELWINIRPIGDGAFGSVWLQEETPSGKKRAVKKILRSRTAEKSLSRELRPLILVRDCEHIIKFYGWYESLDFYFIAMEYAEHGDLDQYLKDSALKPASERQAKEITYQIFKGLAVLHEKGICHRDLKPQNVLITSLQPIHVKLADFGVSKCIEGTELRTMLGTQGYLAPEILGALPQNLRYNGSNSYTKAVDIWALGCLLYNIFTLEVPFLAPEPVGEESAIMSMSGVQGYYQRELDFSLLYRYCSGESHVLAGSLQTLGVAESMFVNRLLVVDPQSRISAAAALMDPWFSQPSYTPNPLLVTPNPPLATHNPSLATPNPPLATPNPPMVTSSPSDPHKRAQYTGLRDYGKDLIGAASGGRIDLVYTLLAAGANVRGRDNEQNTALHRSASKGHYEVVKVLLEHGADSDLGAVNKDGRTALHLAAWSDHEAVVRLLLAKGSNVNAVDNGGRTVLHVAASMNRGTSARILIEEGADLCVVDNNGDNVLHLAAWLGHGAIVQTLLRNGADLGAVNKGGDTALLRAAFTGQVDVVRLLLEKGADLSAVDIRGGTALHIAAKSGHAATIQLLLEKGAGLNTVRRDGGTALHLATMRGREDAVKVLIEHGADINLGDKFQTTALHNASLYGREAVVRRLVEKGADLSAVDNLRDTALHAAASRGHEAVLQFLLEMGADLSVINSSGYTALSLAAKRDHSTIMRRLLEKGADLNVGGGGKTLVELSSDPACKKVLEEFMSKGAAH